MCHAPTQSSPTRFIPTGQFHACSPEGAVLVPMDGPAGSVIFFNFGILHCTRDNLSDQDRAALVYHFLQADNRPLDI
ncbi:MAG: phytanoyl-CoA dioxygenase family protein [Chloroflexi bacterium]|nr:phytanoyl-CoA dioxygenase family protein [Chloroflexota bacterium]